MFFARNACRGRRSVHVQGREKEDSLALILVPGVPELVMWVIGPIVLGLATRKKLTGVRAQRSHRTTEIDRTGLAIVMYEASSNFRN